MGGGSSNERIEGRGVAYGSGVEVVIPISFQVRDFLREKNYVVGSGLDGEVTSGTGDTPEHSWGILLPVDKPSKRFLGIKLPSGNPRKPFLGKVDLEIRSEFVDKFKDKDWVLSVYGRQNLERMQQLASDMAVRFGKKIGLILVAEEQKIERRLSDYSS